MEDTAVTTVVEATAGDASPPPSILVAVAEQPPPSPPPAFEGGSGEEEPTLAEAGSAEAPEVSVVAATEKRLELVLATTLEAFDGAAQAELTTRLRGLLECHEPSCTVSIAAIDAASVRVEVVVAIQAEVVGQLLGAIDVAAAARRVARATGRVVLTTVSVCGREWVRGGRRPHRHGVVFVAAGPEPAKGPSARRHWRRAAKEHGSSAQPWL